MSFPIKSFLLITMRDVILQDGVWLKSRPVSPKKVSPPGTAARLPSSSSSKVVRTDTANDWEIDNNQLKLGQKVASGAFGDL